ncbi:MAG: HEAT repeat domain-containing protein [Candidatus Acidiferrales bacterium]
MTGEIKGNPPGTPCAEFEQRIVLYAADELEREERSEVETHLAGCHACSASLAGEHRLLELLAGNGAEEPSANLLAGCRTALDEKIDEISESRTGFRGVLARWSETLFPGRWFALHPALSAALFVLVGFSVGTLAPRLLRQQAQVANSLPGPEATTVTTSATNGFTPAQTVGTLPFDEQALRSADVSGINWTPGSGNEAPKIEVQMNAAQPVVLRGTVDNNDVKRVLLYVLRNNKRFSPDVRLDSVELLKARGNDPDIRQALCDAVRTDGNAAVRLKALEALNGAEPQDLVRNTLLGALADDSNPGVRIEAMNALRSMAEKGALGEDPGVLRVLRERMQKDSNPYIRIQSASVIRDLGPREKY